MRSFRICAAAFALLAFAGPLSAIPAGAQDINGQWSCIWVDFDRDWEFECQMNLIVDPAGQALGEIRWTMTRSPKPEDQSRIGLGGTEYVRGTMQGHGTLSLDGYDKDDPAAVIGLDRYRLEISHSGRWLYGPTWTHGDWTGRFFATRP